ncbi:MAG: helix-turn-helix transcriptional regulator [Candidatus Methanomethylicaceae archaeon]
MPESVDERILAFLHKLGGEYILQSTLSKSLGIDGKTLSRALQKLETRGLIKREPYQDGRRRTYKIVLIKRERKADLNDVNWVSCIVCPDLERCGRGQPISPETCEKLTAAIKLEYQYLSSTGAIKSAH